MHAKLVFDDSFTERDEAEMSLRGYCSAASVELGDGRRCPVVFYDPVRLQQTIEADLRSGRACFAEPALIIVSEVTRKRMEAAVADLSGEDFFSAYSGEERLRR
jgi:hypothetical protein